MMPLKLNQSASAHSTHIIQSYSIASYCNIGRKKSTSNGTYEYGSGYVWESQEIKFLTFKAGHT